MIMYINSLVNDRILGLSKLEAVADNKLNVTWMLSFVFEREENFIEKRSKCWSLALYVPTSIDLGLQCLACPSVCLFVCLFVCLSAETLNGKW